MGKSYVLIYDGTYWDQKSNDYLPLQKGEQKFHMLRIGGNYNIETRKVVK
jgi:cyanophycinase